MTEDTTPPSNDETPTPIEDTPMWFYSLIMADVVFTCELGVQSRRIQFVSKADMPIFTQSRLSQLNQMAGNAVGRDVIHGSNGAVKNVKILEVFLTSIVDLGCMDEVTFNDQQTVSIDETAVGDTAPAASGDNVVPFPG